MCSKMANARERMDLRIPSGAIGSSVQKPAALSLHPQYKELGYIKVRICLVCESVQELVLTTEVVPMMLPEKTLRSVAGETLERELLK